MILVWFWRFAGNLMTSLRLANCSMFVPHWREMLGSPYIQKLHDAGMERSGKIVINTVRLWVERIRFHTPYFKKEFATSWLRSPYAFYSSHPPTLFSTIPFWRISVVPRKRLLKWICYGYMKQSEATVSSVYSLAAFDAKFCFSRENRSSLASSSSCTLTQNASLSKSSGFTFETLRRKNLTLLIQF